MRVLKVANTDDISYLDMLSYVHQLTRSYSWCLIPWDVCGTGQMIALIASEEAIFKRAKDWLMGGGNCDLMVSSYSIDELEEKRFNGAIFRGSDDLRGQHLWRHGRGSSDSALVLTYDPTRSRLQNRLPMLRLFARCLGISFKLSYADGFEFGMTMHFSIPSTGTQLSLWDWTSG